MAYDIGPRIGITGEQTFRKSIRDINSELRELKSEMGLVESSFGKSAKSEDALTEKSKILNKQIETQKKLVKEQSDMLEKCADKYGEADSKTQNWQNTVNLSKTKLNELNAQLKENEDAIARYSTKWTEAQENLTKAGDKVSKLGDSLESTGKKLTTTVTLPIVAAGTAITTSFINLEDGMAKVNTIANVSEDELSKLSDGLIDISNNTNTAKDDLTEGFYQALSSGVEVVGDGSSALEFMSENAKLAKAGFSDLSTTVDLTTTIINAYGMSQEDITHISDVLIQTQNLGKTTVAELGSEYGKLIPIAKNVGVSYEQSAAAMATMTKNGIGTAESTTYLRSMMNELGKDGSTVAGILEEKTGQSFKDLMDAGYSLSDALNIVQQAADEQGTSINNLFSSQEAGIAATTLLTDAGNDYNDCLAQMQDATGKTDDAFNTIANTTGEKLKTAFNKLTNAGTEFGDAIAPMLESFSELVSDAADSIDGLTDSQKELIVKALAVTAAVGPVVLIVGKLTKAVGTGAETLATFSGAMTVLKTGAEAATPEIGTMANTIKTLTSPTALAVAGVVALAAAAYGLNEAFNKNLPALREQREEYNKIKTSVDNAVSSTQNYIDSTDASLASSGAQIQTAEALAGKIEDLADKQNRSAAENATLNAMILEFNGIVPDANLAIDSNTGTLNLNRDAIQEVIDKRKEQLRVEAVASASKDATAQQLENAMALNDAAAELNDLKAQEREELSKVDPNLSQNEQLRQRGVIQARYNSQIQALQSSISDLEAEQEKLNDKMSDYNKMIDDPSYYDTYINSASEAADAANNLADANDGVGDAKAGADAAVGDTTAQDTFEGANKDAEASVSSLNQNGSKSAYDFMANYNAAMGQSTTGGTNAFTAGVLTGVPKISSGFSNWISAAVTVMQPLIPNLNAFGVSGGENFSSGLKSQDGNVSNAAELLKQAAMNPFGSIGQDGNIFGLSFGNNIGSGIGSTQGNVQTNSGILKNAATSPFLGFGAEGGGIGWGFGSGISTGIGNTKSSVSTSSTDVKQNAMLSPFSGIGASGTGIGSNYIAGIDQGQQNKKAYLEAGSTTLVDLMKSTFFRGLKISSPSKVGVYIGENWIQGLMNGMEDNDLISFTKGIISEFTSLFTSGNLSIQSLTSMMGDNISKVLQMMGIGGGSGLWPVEGEITSYFGNRDAPTIGASTYHEGIDIAAALGTAVKAFNTGVVQFAGNAGGYGNQVIIDHLNGLVTYYSHLNDIMVSAGQTVTQGQQIGTVGSTGISTGPHLDFRTQQNGTFVDPLTYLNSGSSSSSGGNVESWITQALQITGMYNSQNLANTVALAMAESGGDPNAINLWDSNAAAGHPSKGLMQTIDSTFEAYKLPGYDNIWDPVSNAIASIRYQMSRYGYLRGTPGYAVGTTNVPYDMLAVVHAKEAIVPASENPYTNSGGSVIRPIVDESISELIRALDVNSGMSNRQIILNATIEMNGQKVGEITAPFVAEENNFQSRRNSRLKGGR